MTKKYKFTGNTQDFCGVIVKQIWRLSDGKIGGWIESEKNLSHEGRAWIDSDAIVHGNVIICGDTVIYDCVEIYGDISISNVIIRGYNK